MEKAALNNPYSTPVSDIVSNVDDSSINVFKRFSAWFVFLLNLVTLGIYSYVWFYLRSRTINTDTDLKISEVLIYIICGVYVVSTGLEILALLIELPLMILQYNIISVYLTALLQIFGFFALRSCLLDLLRTEKTIGLKVSGFMTFFFGAIYLQYKINEALDIESGKLEVVRTNSRANESSSKAEDSISPVEDSELIVDGIEFGGYSEDELRDCLANIDQQKYPERTRVINLALTRFG